MDKEPQWVLTKCSIFGNCKVNDIYDPKVYILGSHNQLKMNFYHCKHFHKSQFTFFGNFAYVILESVNFKMIFQPSSGLRWLSGWILSEKLVFWRSVGLTVPFLTIFCIFCMVWCIVWSNMVPLGLQTSKIPFFHSKFGKKAI